MKKPPSTLGNVKGFSLVELIIVVAILGIIASIAIPAYRNYITSSKRETAEAALGQFSILLESFRAENGSFPPTGVYTYTEAANGAVTSNTIMTGAGLTDFLPRPATLPAGQGIMFNYSLTITNSGLANEAATFTATGVREAAGINAAGNYQ